MFEPASQDSLSHINFSYDGGLPPELLGFIFSMMGCSELLICKQVCKLFSNIIDSTASLRLIIELHAAGQEYGNTNNSLTPAERIEALRAHEAAWDELNWTTEKRIPLLGGGLWELCGGVLAQSTQFDDIKFNRLPSVHRFIDEKEWTDLLVLVENPSWSGSEVDHMFRIHLCKMSTGAHHFLGSQPTIIRHPQETEDRGVSFSILISGDHLGVLFFNVEEENQMIIWNWKSGMAELALFGDEMRSFTFLDCRFITVALLTSPFIPSSDGTFTGDLEPRLLVVNFKEEPHEMRPVRQAKHVFTFCYPPLNGYADPINFTIQSDPAPGWTPEPGLQVPFFTAQDNRIYVITLWLSVRGGSPCVIAFAPRSTFLKRIYNQQLGRTSNTFEWESWGPHETRMLIPNTLPTEIWVCNVSGSRYVTLCKEKKEVVMKVYNFNQQALIRSIDQNIKAGVNSNHITKANTLKGVVFDGQVSTSLPYRIWNLPLGIKSVSHVAVLCNEDNIIIVDSRHNRREYRVLTF